MGMSLAELTNPGTTTDAQSEVLTALAAFPTLPVTAWQDGSVGKTLALIEGALLADVRALIAQIARAGFVTSQPGVTGAAGNWLDLAGSARYGLTRNTAVAAVHSVVLTDAAGAGPFTIVSGQVWVANTVSLAGQTPLRFSNTTGGTLPRNGTLTLPCQAEAPGAAYDVAPGTITSLLTVFPGVTVTNPDLGNGSSLTTQGIDIESDVAYALRCIGRWAQLGSGSPAAAYDSWARTASQEVTRTRVQQSGTTAGEIDLILAGPSGSVSTVAISAVTAVVTPRVAFPATISVTNASAQPVAVNATVYVASAYRDVAQAAGEAALLAMFQAIPIGGTIYFSSIIDALQRQTGVRNVALSAPTLDTALGASSVATLSGARTYVGV